jgi:hypothetical protein
MIYQYQLRLLQQLREAGRRYDAVRQELVNLLTNGSRIEPGPLTAFLRESSSQRLSWSRIEQVWGRAAVDDLRARVPFTVSKAVIVQPAEQGLPQRVQTSQPFRIQTPR